MKKIGWALVLVLLVGLPSAGLAAPLTYTLTLPLTLAPAGSDMAGLAGATLSLSATFASGTVYVAAPFPLSAFSASHTLTISGSAGSDGPYFDPAGASLIFEPGAFFQILVDMGALGLDFPGLAMGQTLMLSFFITPPAVIPPPIPMLMGGMTTAHFGTMFFIPPTITTMPDMTVYALAGPPMLTATGGPTPVELLSFEIE